MAFMLRMSKTASAAPAVSKAAACEHMGPRPMKATFFPKSGGRCPTVSSAVAVSNAAATA